MTNEQKIEAFSRRLQGETYKSIADSYGVSKQYIEQTLKGGVCGRKVTEKSAKKCVYKGLAEYMERNNVSTLKLTKMLGYTSANYVTIGKKLAGLSQFDLKIIKKILEITGMTFEECFALKESVTSDGE